MSEKKGTSGVDYSKVADRHVDDARYEKLRAPEQAPKKMSAQMDAVFRLMTGKDERTIADKLADSNRPTWEQYKKENEDKLDIVGLDQKQMEKYRRELDEDREKKLNRGLNHGGGKDKKKKRRRRNDDDSDDDSSGDESERRHKRKHRKKKRKKKHHKRHRSDSESTSENDSSDDDSRRKRHKKKKKRKHKKTEKKEGGMDDGHRLSSFFQKGSDSE